MNNFLRISLFLILFGLNACDKIDQEYSDEFTFGIRHDKSLSEYESLVTSNSLNMPDMSPVVCFQYSLNGSADYEYVASGTLIDEEWILTAGHNFYVASEQSSPAPASGILVVFGNDPNNPLQTREVESLHFHPSWINQNDVYFYANDLCLVKLKSAVDNVNPAELLTTKTESVGSTTWFGGFGDYSQEPGQNRDEYSRKHAIQNILDRSVDNISSSANGINYVGGLLAFDFDNPSGTINSLGDSRISPDEDLLGNGTSDNLCTEFEGATVEGDSGGPLFIEDGSTWKIAGVLSGGTPEPIKNHLSGSYGDISVFIRVSTHIDWINTVVQ